MKQTPKESRAVYLQSLCENKEILSDLRVIKKYCSRLGWIVPSEPMDLVQGFKDYSQSSFLCADKLEETGAALLAMSKPAIKRGNNKNKNPLKRSRQ